MSHKLVAEFKHKNMISSAIHGETISHLKYPKQIIVSRILIFIHCGCFLFHISIAFAHGQCTNGSCQSWNYFITKGTTESRKLHLGIEQNLNLTKFYPIEIWMVLSLTIIRLSELWSLCSQWTRHYRYMYHTTGFDRTYCTKTKYCMW